MSIRLPTTKSATPTRHSWNVTFCTFSKILSTHSNFAYNWTKI